MFIKKIILILLVFLLYQSHAYTKSPTSTNFNTENLNRYFSGIVAFENNDNSAALDFFSSSKILIDTHDPYLKRYIYSLVLQNKISQAINLVKRNKDKDNSNFFDAHLLLIVDSLKKKNFDEAQSYIKKISKLGKYDRFNSAIIESLEQYVFVFKDKKIPNNSKNFGKLSTISETFQRCYLDDKKTDTFFFNLYNDLSADYSRYIFFYLSYLIESNRISDAKETVKKINYINTTLLLSQAKSWIDNENSEQLIKVFSCKNSNDVISEFLFLISNLYSSQDEFNKSNFYLNLSNFLNPKFIFNLALIAENHYLNGEYEKAGKVLRNFKKEENFYYWYRVKKEAQIIAKQQNEDDSLNYITTQYNKIDNPNNKIVFDLANFYKNSKKYNKAIEYYTKIINTIDDDEIKSDLFYRRGASYERIKDYKNADKDLLNALKIKTDDAYILNYLAYSWLERNYKINEAITMLEKAYEAENDDPYIIDSIGWAYYLIDDFIKAEEFMKRAVELMPDDPIVNDHYGDILWKLNRRIQARYFWSNVLKMEDADKEIIKNINKKMIEGLKSS